MKKTTRIISAILALVLLCSLAITAFAEGAGTEVYTSETQLSSDLTYRNTVSYDGDKRVESFTLEDKAGGDVFPIVMACDTIYGGMTMPQIISYASSQGYNVLGAVNTDFFTTNKIPMGMVIENGIVKSSPGDRNVLSIGYDGSYAVTENCALSIALTNMGGGAGANNAGKTVVPSHLNKTRVDVGGTYLYSHHYSSISTRTSTDGWAVKFKIVSGDELRLGTPLTLEVTEVYTGSEAMSLQEGYLVLTAAAASAKEADFASFAVGDTVSLSMTASGNLANAKWATGCGDLLVSGGSVTDSAAWDTAISAAHPRTLMGIKADGTAVYCVVDGRKASHSGGLTLAQAAEEMAGRGCTTVVNFDGGGSSAMAVRLPGSNTAKVVNSPSDGSPRSCAAYILLCTTGVSDGKAARLFLSQNGSIIYKGATMNLSCYAMDAGYITVKAGTVSAHSSGGGTISGGKYTATNAGYDTITLTGTGTSGTGQILVTDTLTDIGIQDLAGEDITELKVDENGMTAFSVVGKYYGEDVITAGAQFEYSVSEEVGILTADEYGVIKLHATGTPGTTGTLEISGGGMKASIPVRVRYYFPDVVGKWYCDYVMDLYDDGIVTGTSETSYSPTNSIKRGDFILMLYRAAGQPEVTSKSAFTDVKDSDYYAAAITWASENGIAKGTGGTTFAPKASLTREQAFTFVYRALSKLGISASDGEAADIESFTDVSGVDKYAIVPTATLVKHGIIQGSDGKLNPNASLNRAEMAKILWETLDLK